MSPMARNRSGASEVTNRPTRSSRQRRWASSGVGTSPHARSPAATITVGVCGRTRSSPRRPPRRHRATTSNRHAAHHRSHGDACPPGVGVAARGDPPPITRVGGCRRGPAQATGATHPGEGADRGSANDATWCADPCPAPLAHPVLHGTRTVWRVPSWVLDVPFVTDCDVSSTSSTADGRPISQGANRPAFGPLRYFVLLVPISRDHLRADAGAVLQGAAAPPAVGTRSCSSCSCWGSAARWWAWPSSARRTRCGRCSCP